MANLAFYQSFGDMWPPDAVEGGIILTRSTTAMSYLSDLGYTITLRGSGLTYDEDGQPGTGTINRVTIALDGVTYADFTGVSAGFGRLATWAFGFERGHGRFENPNGYNFMQHLWRGSDSIVGSDQDDDIMGGLGNDTIVAGDGDDFIHADAGNDLLYGGNGDSDTLTFDESYFDSTAFSGVFLDVQAGTAIDAWGGQDTVLGFERFRDSVFNDTLLGSSGEDRFTITRGADSVDGRDGDDRVDFSEGEKWGAARGVNVNLVTGIAIDSWKSTDRLTSIEEVITTSFNDTITGSGADEMFMTGAGVDVIDGGAGFDRLAFWRVGENDDGGHGININLSQTTSVIDDGYGNSENAKRIEAIDGSQFDDLIVGSSAANSFWGDNGNDTLNGSSGNDTLHGANGDDSIIGGADDDRIQGGAGVDSVFGGSGFDRLVFWDLGYDDDGGHGVNINLGLAVAVIDDGYGNAETATSIEGVDGSQFGDKIVGNSGTNEIWGDDGNDTISGGDGEDFLDGGEGRDTITGGSGDDHIGGNEGNDTLTGNSGADDFNFFSDLGQGGVDIITDMAVGVDQIWIGSWWGGGLVNEDLTANQFRSGAGVTTASTADQRVIYNTSTGALYFDADGNGSANAAVRIATLLNKAAITFDDVLVML